MRNNRFWSLDTARWVLITNAVVLILCSLKVFDHLPSYLDSLSFYRLNKSFMIWFKFFLPLTTILTLSIKSFYGDYDDKNIAPIRFGLFFVLLVFLLIVAYIAVNGNSPFFAGETGSLDAGLESRERDGITGE